MPALAALFVFLALATAAVALLWPATRRAPLEARIRGLRPGGPEPAVRANSPSTRRRAPASRWPRLLAGRSRGAALEQQLRQANVRLRAGEFVLARWLLALAGFALPALVSGLHPVGLVLGVAGGIAAYAAPGWWLAAARQKRIARIEKQLVEFLPLLASSLRSGFALQQGIESAANRVGPPLGDDLLALVSDLKLGASLQAALQDLTERVGSGELEIIVTAILVQRTTGGNLAEVLDHAAETLAERERIRGELQTLTAQQRFTGFILSAYPIAVGLLLLLIMPNVWSRLFTETAGQVQLGIAATLQVAGFLAIRRTLRVEY